MALVNLEISNSSCLSYGAISARWYGHYYLEHMGQPDLMILKLVERGLLSPLVVNGRTPDGLGYVMAFESELIPHDVILDDVYLFWFTVGQVEAVEAGTLSSVPNEDYDEYLSARYTIDLQRELETAKCEADEWKARLDDALDDVEDLKAQLAQSTRYVLPAFVREVARLRGQGMTPSQVLAHFLAHKDDYKLSERQVLPLLYAGDGLTYEAARNWMRRIQAMERPDVW